MGNTILLCVYFPLLLLDVVSMGRKKDFSLTTLTRVLLLTRMPDMFLLFSVLGNAVLLPLDLVINEPANQFDFQFENVFLFFSQ